MYRIIMQVLFIPLMRLVWMGKYTPKVNGQQCILTVLDQVTGFVIVLPILCYQAVG